MKSPAVGIDHPPAGFDRDAPGGEELRDGGARRGAEHLQRRVFGGDEAHPQVSEPEPLAAIADQQRQLVEGQRPARRRRHHQHHGRTERDPCTVDQLVNREVGAIAPERLDTLVCGLDPTPDADDEERVGQRVVAIGDREVIARRDAVERSSDQLDSELRQRRGQLAPLRRLVGERLLDRQRLVEEVGLRREQAEPGPVPAHVRQGERGFEPGDPAAGDQHARLLIDLGRGHSEPRTAKAEHGA